MPFDYISEAPRGYTLLSSLHSEQQLELARREQGLVKSVANWREFPDGSCRRFYRCREKGCSYAMCALIKPEEDREGEEEDGETRMDIQLHVKGVHNHRSIRPVVPRPDPNGELERLEENVEEIKI